MTEEYLSYTEVAKRLGLNSTGSLSRMALPAPDVTIGRTRGWSAATIDKWAASRPGRGNWTKGESRRGPTSPRKGGGAAA